MFCALPLDAFGRVVAGSLITPADAVASAIAAMTLERLAAGRYRIRARLDWAIGAYGIFLLLGAIGVLFSPDAWQISLKALVQIAGIAIMLLVTIALANEVARRPVLFADYVRLCTITLAIVSLIGVAQFLCANVLGHPEVLEFSFLNRWARGNVWYNQGSLDGIVRANSILQEPSALGMVLGTVAGVALMRLGIVGASQRDALIPLVPAWAAILIVAGYVVTVSLIDFILLLIVGAAIWAVPLRNSKSAIGGLLAVIVVMGGFSYTAIISTLPDVGKKIASMGAIASDDIRVERAEDLSAIALAVNLSVMRSNLARAPLVGAGLGAHPITYDRENPGLGRLPADLMTVGMNKEDAASLLIRLLSETGILGTLAFVAGWILALAASRRTIIASIDTQMTPNVFSALAIGVTASMAGIGVACLARAPQYYAPWFWLPMALTMSVPELLVRVEHDARRPPRQRTA